ncbi:hypothetical protein FB567DRAFT_182889 [Paraphoma chrysanthemicola]|uniref:Extracellular membrane protein CFEM domain-containing protein n=1 Tax=Paraphoma chrysanthemicola TaxID=798071 RepID=A0A8K0VUE5_9PLEO|nr:hypothetical protein FB567DRAFT_182889 [Paraphoma chrysanthemicola]
MTRFTYFGIYLLSLGLTSFAQETFTNPQCRAQTSAFGACAKRWDSIRTECTKSVTTNTIWPGPCECAYFANDLPCFDEQALCAAQVWTQVPQWFRDGVSSCLMKDAGFTIRAALGSAEGVMGNPFTVVGLAGRATRTSAAVSATGTGVGEGAATATPGAGMARPTGVAVRNEEMSVGAKAGFGVGIGVGVVLIGVMAFLIVRSRRRMVEEVDAEKKRGLDPAELHDDEAHIHQISSKMPTAEMQGTPRYELGVRASTWVVELPVANSHRNSRQTRT